MLGSRQYLGEALCKQLGPWPCGLAFSGSPCVARCGGPGARSRHWSSWSSSAVLLYVSLLGMYTGIVCCNILSVLHYVYFAASCYTVSYSTLSYIMILLWWGAMSYYAIRYFCYTVVHFSYHITGMITTLHETNL